MSGDEPDKHEKTEDATPFKLDEARKKGMVSKSQEVGVAASMIAILLLVLGLGVKMAKDILVFCHEIFIQSGNAVNSVQPILAEGEQWVWRGINIIAPFAVMLMLVGIVVSLWQTGPVFSAHPLKPDWKRLNPVAGFKRIFSKRILFELFKSVVKLVILTVVIVAAFESEFDQLVALAFISPSRYLESLIDVGVGLLFKLTVALILLAILDRQFVTKTFLTSMKMTRRELKDEYKRRDGDPNIKSKRRELERELRKRSESMAAVKNADVVITNPTHYAVLLKYDRKLMRAPAVTGKGVNRLAEKIREEAWVHGVPIIQSPELARFLFKKVKVDQPVPESTYVSIARILHKAAQLKNRKQ